MRKNFLQFPLLPLAAALAVTGAMAAGKAATVPTAGMFVQPATFSNGVVVPTPASAPAPAASTPSSGGTTTGTTSGTTTTPASGTGTTPGSNPATATAVISTQGTPSSATASGTPTPGQTSGVSQAGTSTGDAFSGSSRGEAPAVGSLAASGVTTNTNQTGINTTLASNGALGFPVVVDNGMVAAGGVALNGERFANPAVTTAGAATTFTSADIVPQVGVATSATTDPLVRRELQKRRSVKRNSQLLYSIAPRTNANRGWQMPDDPISPALRPPA